MRYQDHETGDTVPLEFAVSAVVEHDYKALRDVLDAAYDQAAYGKGKKRHARNNPFHEQHMQSISRLLDSDAGMAFQVVKKLTEGLDMADHDARERELLGAIVYLAGIVVYWRGGGS